MAISSFYLKVGARTNDTLQVNPKQRDQMGDSLLGQLLFVAVYAE
jgi:hypothetical protein